MMKQQLNIKIEAAHTLEQHQMLSLHILELNNYELNQFLIKESMENPLVELNTVSEGDLFFEYGQGKTYDPADVLNFVADEEYDNYDMFLSQLDYRKVSKKQQVILKMLIDLMDDGGYIRMMPGELADILTYSTEEISACLEILQHLQPYGAGASNLRDCLCIQLECMGLLDETAEEIIRHHLEDIAFGKQRKIMQALSLTEEQVMQYTRLIKQLNPRPLNGLTKGRNHYIVPDLIFAKDGQKWNVMMNDTHMYEFRINDDYRDANKQFWDKSTKAYYSEKLGRAQLIEKCIAQRKQTLFSIGIYILQYQQAYFNKCGPLKPLNLKMIAEAAGVHESTVSRTLKDKYVQWPGGTALLRSFLVGAASGGKNTEDSISSRQIKDALKKLVLEEDKQAPYSDNELACKLKELGMSISRRTVAKYRSQLDILSAQQRKIV